MYRWDFAPVWANADLLVAGLAATLHITGTAFAFGNPLGLALALARLSSRRALRLPAGAVIEVLRTMPPRVQLFWFFFALPILLRVEMTPFVAAALTFSIQSAAFFAEVFRGGIVSVERGQCEAGRALGMTPRQLLRRVVLPQALRRMLPALTHRGIEIVTMSTLASAVAYVELLQRGKLLAPLHFNPIGTYTVIAVVFLLGLLPLVQATYWPERHLGRVDR